MATNDQLRVTASDVPVDLGDGYDRLIVDGGTGIEIDSYFDWNAEEVHGSNGGNDDIDMSDADTTVRLYGRKGDDILHGGSENDLIDGGSGNDILYGNGGNDVLRGRSGEDKFFGGDGNDIIIADHVDFSPNPGTVVVDGGDGYDVLAITDNIGVDIKLGDDVVGIEEFQGSNDDAANVSGIDIADFSAATSTVNLFGRKGNDFLTGGSGDDGVRGGSGDDLLVGRQGADVIQGDRGSDTIWTGVKAAGNTADGAVDIVKAGEGNDEIFAEGIDIIQGGLGTDTLVIDGATGATLIGYDFSSIEDFNGSSTGNDFVDYSDATVDLRLDGRGGDDTLLAGSGDDLLLGSAGADILKGGKGDDQLKGAGGDDTYVFELGDGQDTLIDTTGANEVASFVGAGFDTSSVAFRRTGKGLLVGYGDANNFFSVDNAFATSDFSDWTAGTGELESLELDSLGLAIADLSAAVEALHTFADANAISINSLSDVFGNASLMSEIATAYA